MLPAQAALSRHLQLPAEELLARYAAGEGVPALALRYGCAEPTVRAHLRRLGALPPAQPKRRAEITRAALEELYAQRRWPIIRIAAHFGVSPVTVEPDAGPSASPRVGRGAAPRAASITGDEGRRTKDETGATITANDTKTRRFSDLCAFVSWRLNPVAFVLFVAFVVKLSGPRLPDPPAWWEKAL